MKKLCSSLINLVKNMGAELISYGYYTDESVFQSLTCEACSVIDCGWQTVVFCQKPDIFIIKRHGASIPHKLIIAVGKKPTTAIRHCPYLISII